MNIVSSVRIDGFWGDHSVDIQFHDDVNFLIGPNGSGKTTVINLIAAALTGDFAMLDRAPFENLSIVIKDVSSAKVGRVIVTKQTSPKLPFPKIDYTIEEPGSEIPQSFSLDDVEEHVYMRNRGYIRRGLLRRQGRNIVEILGSLIGTSWLSIHRTRLEQETGDDASYESTIDKKLVELSNGLVRYFAVLSRGGAELLDAFQKEFFLALLIDEELKYGLHQLQELDMQTEKDALIEIFERFHLQQYQFHYRVDRHFKFVSSALEKMANNGGYSESEIAAMFGTIRLHSVVQRWQKLIQEQQRIFAPRQTFVAILNELFQRKRVQINEKNELIAITQSGKRLAPQNLSSGEKQLLILLGEALLQEQKPHVYIADEPELSLHVSWQEKLIDNIRRVNPRAQIIVATHSPDIVGGYSDRTFRMEGAIK